MTVSQTNKFNPAFPESYPWRNLDNRTQSAFGEILSNRIKDEAEHKPIGERNNIPGLRVALCLLANMAEIYQQ